MTTLDQYLTYCEGRLRKARVLLDGMTPGERPTFTAMLRSRVAHYEAEIAATRRFMAMGTS